MTHAESVERLPWFANGTLAAAERVELEAHLAGCADCRAELAATLVALRLHEAAHPASDELIAYLLRELPTGQEAAVADHLALCADCRGAVELARASHAVDAVLPELERSGRRPPSRTTAPRRRLLRLAATVVVVAGATLLAVAAERRVGRLESERARLAAEVEVNAGTARAERSLREAAEVRAAQLAAPRGGVALVELLPRGAARGRESAAPRLRAIPEAPPFATVLLALGEPRRDRTYQLTVGTADGGAPLFVLERVPVDPRGILVLQLPLAELPAGRLTITATPGGGPETATEQFELELSR